MAKIIDTRTQMDQTVRIFDSFYATSLVVNTNQYDVVHGFFRSVCPTKNIADNFTAVLFRICQETNIDALVLLQELKGVGSKIKINKVMAYYLNSFKSKTSLYGIGNVPRSVQPVARNIVQ